MGTDRQTHGPTHPPTTSALLRLLSEPKTNSVTQAPSKGGRLHGSLSGQLLPGSGASNGLGLLSSYHDESSDDTFVRESGDTRLYRDW